MKHPLRRFLAVGVLLFAADAGWTALSRSPNQVASEASEWTDEDVLVREALARDYHRTDPVVRRRLARNLRFALDAKGRSDTDLVDEALALGMHRSDPLVRRRLVQKLRLLSQEHARTIEPSESELLAFYEHHSDRFGTEERVRLVQIFFRDEREAARFRPSSAPVAAGDALPLPRELPALSERELAGRFGRAFATATFRASTGRWTGPVRSSFGYHWVRVEERSPLGPAPLAAVRPAVREALLAERAEERLRRLVETLRAENVS